MCRVSGTFLLLPSSSHIVLKFVTHHVLNKFSHSFTYFESTSSLIHLLILKVADAAFLEGGTVARWRS